MQEKEKFHQKIEEIKKVGLKGTKYRVPAELKDTVLTTYPLLI